MHLHQRNDRRAKQAASSPSKPAVARREMPMTVDHAYIALTAMGALVSLVSLSVTAPPLTAKGALVSEDCCASTNTCAVSSDRDVEGGGGGDPPW
jgi:hypothetical protein